MKGTLLVFGFLLTLVSGSSLVNIRLPFLNPAGVTYINGQTPTGLVAGPVPVQYSAPPQLQQISYAPQPLLKAAPIGFAQPVLRAAPLLQPRVPAVADIPVTHIEAHHGVVQNIVDVAKPAIKTRKYEVRRPAIQKNFYDIEERVIVRPAGSALVELDHPISKNQKGVDLISPAHAIPVAGLVHQPVFVSSTAVPAVGVAPVDIPFEHHQPTQPAHEQPQPQHPPQHQPQPEPPQNNEDSVVIEARSRLQQAPQSQQINQPNFRGAQQQTEAFFPQPQSQPRQQQPEFEPQRQQQEQLSFAPQRQQQQQPGELQRQQQIQLQELQQQQQNQLQQLQQRHIEEQQIFQQQNENTRSAPPPPPQRPQGNDQFRIQPEPENHSQEPQSPLPPPHQHQPQVESQSNGEAPAFRFNQPSEPESPIIYSRQIAPEESHSNQQRFIQLLTANNGISEIGHPQIGARSSNIINADFIRARVLSATPGTPNAPPTDERINTRRVVLSRPIETVQEVVVQEPVTKFEKVAVNTPTIFKTARLGVQRVHTSLPALPLFHH